MSGDKKAIKDEIDLLAGQEAVMDSLIKLLNKENVKIATMAEKASTGVEKTPGQLFAVNLNENGEDCDEYRWFEQAIKDFLVTFKKAKGTKGISDLQEKYTDFLRAWWGTSDTLTDLWEAVSDSPDEERFNKLIKNLKDKKGEYVSNLLYPLISYEAMRAMRMFGNQAEKEDINVEELNEKPEGPAEPTDERTQLMLQCGNHLLDVLFADREIQNEQEWIDSREGKEFFDICEKIFPKFLYHQPTQSNLRAAQRSQEDLDNLIFKHYPKKDADRTNLIGLWGRLTEKESEIGRLRLLETILEEEPEKARLLIRFFDKLLKKSPEEKVKVEKKTAVEGHLHLKPVITPPPSVVDTDSEAGHSIAEGEEIELSPEQQIDKEVDAEKNRILDIWKAPEYSDPKILDKENKIDKEIKKILEGRPKQQEDFIKFYEKNTRNSNFVDGEALQLAKKIVRDKNQKKEEALLQSQVVIQAKIKPATTTNEPVIQTKISGQRITLEEQQREAALEEADAAAFVKEQLKALQRAQAQVDQAKKALNSLGVPPPPPPDSSSSQSAELQALKQQLAEQREQLEEASRKFKEQGINAELERSRLAEQADRQAAELAAFKAIKKPPPPPPRKEEVEEAATALAKEMALETQRKAAEEIRAAQEAAIRAVTEAGAATAEAERQRAAAEERVILEHQERERAQQAAAEATAARIAAEQKAAADAKAIAEAQAEQRKTAEEAARQQQRTASRKDRGTRGGR